MNMYLFLRSLDALCWWTALVFLPAASADNEVSLLRKIQSDYPNWTPRGIVDIGANVGGWTTKVQEEIYPQVKTFMVEAFQKHSVSLQETREKFKSGIVDYAIAVLSASDGQTVKFYNLGPNSFTTGNSMFQEQSTHYKDGGFEERTTVKLDTLLKEKMEYVDYLKLDVQGAELMVLLGATETLKKATFVQFEVSVIEYNKGGACWHQVDELLRQNGFYFYDSGEYNRNEGAFHTKAIGQFDLLYIKPSSDYVPTWLVENNATFCGGHRVGMTPMMLQEPSRLGQIVTATALSSGHTFSLPLVLIITFAFIGGYFIGSRKNGKNLDKKRHL